MKFLAAFTSLGTVPSTIAAFFGMNVDVPLDANIWGFGIILGFSLLLTIVLGIIFWKRDWM